jgi:hypothetical protein
MRYLLIIMLFATVAVRSGLASTELDSANRALAESDADRALKHFKAVDRNDAGYPIALLESARIFYQKNQWPEFFAISAYLRQVYPSTAFSEKARVLEAMALIRHCQYALAEKRLALAAPTVVLEEKWETSRNVMAHWLKALPHAKIDKSTPDDTLGKPKIFVEKIEWPVSIKSSELTRFDPFELKRKVESHCSKGVTP